MTFPILETSSTDFDTGASHVLSLPSGIQSGDLLIAILGTIALPTITFPAGWTLLNQNQSSLFARLHIRSRIADGTEGSSITVTYNQAVEGLFVGLRISGAPQELPSGVQSVGQNTQNPNPPPLTPAGGAKDYLWFAGYYKRNTGFGLEPSGYSASPVQVQQFGDAMQVSQRNLNAASENPGVWNLPPGADNSIAFTMAIAPFIPSITSGISLPTQAPGFFF